MRTTVTLDADTEQIVRARMAERGVSFKQALNDVIREGAADRPAPAPFKTRVHAMGIAVVGLDRALALASDLEDDELLHKLSKRS